MSENSLKRKRDAFEEIRPDMLEKLEKQVEERELSERDFDWVHLRRLVARNLMRG